MGNFSQYEILVSSECAVDSGIIVACSVVELFVEITKNSIFNLLTQHKISKWAKVKKNKMGSHLLSQEVEYMIRRIQLVNRACV